MKGGFLFFIGLQQPADAEKWDVFTSFFCCAGRQEVVE